MHFEVYCQNSKCKARMKPFCPVYIAIFIFTLVCGRLHLLLEILKLLNFPRKCKPLL